MKKHLHFNSHMGRMGNQLFQYACAKGLQWNYGFITSLSDLDQLSFFELEKGERWINRLKSFLFFRYWKPRWGMDILNTKLACMHQSYLKELLALNKPTMVWGFFQSPEYFRGVEDKIRGVLKVKRVYYSGYQNFLLKNNLQEGQYLAIHLRRTDYKGFTVTGLQGDDFTLPVSYYHAAIKRAEWNGRVVFVSDEPEAVEHLFPEIKDKIISREDAITDFLIIENAETCILSNSTFAWWAGWLNTIATKVICPKYFLGFKEQKEIPVNIYPEHWIQVSVYED